MRSNLLTIALATMATCFFASEAIVARAAGAVAAATPPSAIEATPPSVVLPTIGRTRAVTTFCRRIVDDGSALASDQIEDIATTTEALRVLALTPFDRDPFVQRRGSLVLEALAARLMSSRGGAAKTYVADLRKAARGVAPDDATISVKHLNAMPVDPAHVELAQFAAALDGAHAESSRVAQEIAQAVSVLAATDYSERPFYLPDRTLDRDERFSRALRPVPFPVDADLDRKLDVRNVDNGPLHFVARSAAIQISASLDRMLGSVDEARRLFPTAYTGCTAVDERPSADPSPTP